jgi:hypothetical protein
MCIGYGMAIAVTLFFFTIAYLLVKTPTLIQDFWQSLGKPWK